jgi:hypothetical protein
VSFAAVRSTVPFQRKASEYFREGGFEPCCNEKSVPSCEGESHLYTEMTDLLSELFHLDIKKRYPHDVGRFFSYIAAIALCTALELDFYIVAIDFWPYIVAMDLYVVAEFGSCIATSDPYCPEGSCPCIEESDLYSYESDLYSYESDHRSRHFYAAIEVSDCSTESTHSMSPVASGQSMTAMVSLLCLPSTGAAVNSTASDDHITGASDRLMVAIVL